MAVVGPMARFVEDLDLALGVLAPRCAPAERPERIAVYEEDGLQPVSRDCRIAVRRAAAALRDARYPLVEAAPPHPAEVRAAYDAVVATEALSALRPLVAGREDSLSPYLREILAASRDFEPEWTTYLAASRQLARLEVETDGWLERNPVALCPAAPEVAPPLRGAWSAEIDASPRAWAAS